MKCSDLRRQLAHLERLDRPSAEGRAHLSRCDGCRAWYQKLLRIERQVPLLPAPTSQRKAAFINQVLAGHVQVGRTNPNILPLRRSGSRPSLRTDRDRHQQKLALATALAAGLLVFAAAFGALQLKPATPTSSAPAPTNPQIVILEKQIKDLPPDMPALERMDSLVTVAD